MKIKLSPRQRAIAAGYRSGLEEKIAGQLTTAGVSYRYEESKLRYTVPARVAKYTPDFILSNGIIIETKGRFVTADRQKHVLIKKEHPKLDIRFVFSNPNTRISKTSPTTYAMWCERNGFLYSKALVPSAWIDEPENDARLQANARILE